MDSIIQCLPDLMRTDENKARQLIDVLEQRATTQHHQHGIIQSLFFRAWLSYRYDPADVAIAKLDSALVHVVGIQQDTALVNFYILKGQCFVKKAAFGKALDQFKQALHVAAQRGDHTSQTSTLISIGWAYMEDGKSQEAIHFFKEVLHLNPDDSYENRALLLCNIAACYNTLGDLKQAETYAQQGVALARSRADHANLANGLNILARSYYLQGSINKAITLLKEAALVREKVADPSMLASDYLELADLYAKSGQSTLALQWAKKAEAISIQQANALKLIATYESLTGTYETLGDYKNASRYLKKELALKDSVADEHYSQAMAQMQVQFETQKKTAENLQLKKENLEARLRYSHQKWWLLLLGMSVLLLIATGIYSSKLLKSRYRRRLAVEQLNEQKRQTIAVIEAEEKERRRIAGDLHDGVGQLLAAAALQFSKARHDQRQLDQVDALLSRAATEVRSISHQVTPELLLHYGLVKALEQEVVRLNTAQDTTVFTLYTHLEAPLQDDVLSLTIYRCFQELCANILKHAQASEVSIQLTLHGQEMELMVEDNGVGFQPGLAQQGLGLKNMVSRIALFDGTLVVDSTPGRGTTSIITVHKPAASLAKTTHLWNG